MLIFADEFFAGSKESSDKLKGMITESTQTIERKGVDVIETPSYIRVIAASNHENVVRIETDERRYFFLEVSEAMKQNHEYFTKLTHLIKGKDFAGKLLYILLNIDISNFNPRAVPKTEALAKQKLDNLPPLEAWLLHCLRKGSFTSDATLEARIRTDLVTEAAKTWIDENRIQLYGDLPRKVGKLLNDGYAKRTRIRIQDERVYFFEFESLDKMRDKFNKKIGLEIEY